MFRCCGVGQVCGKEGTGAREQDVRKELGEKEPALPPARGKREGNGCAVTGCGQRLQGHVRPANLGCAGRILSKSCKLLQKVLAGSKR